MKYYLSLLLLILSSCTTLTIEKECLKCEIEVDGFWALETKAGLEEALLKIKNDTAYFLDDQLSLTDKALICSDGQRCYLKYSLGEKTKFKVDENNFLITDINSTKKYLKVHESKVDLPLILQKTDLLSSQVWIVNQERSKVDFDELSITKACAILDSSAANCIKKDLFLKRHGYHQPNNKNAGLNNNIKLISIQNNIALVKDSLGHFIIELTDSNQMVLHPFGASSFSNKVYLFRSKHSRFANKLWEQKLDQSQWQKADTILSFYIPIDENHIKELKGAAYQEITAFAKIKIGDNVKKTLELLIPPSRTKIIFFTRAGDILFEASLTEDAELVGWEQSK